MGRPDSDDKGLELATTGTVGRAAGLGDAAAAVNAALEEWRKGDKVQRLWKADTSLWSNANEDQWLGWLEAVETQRGQLQRVQAVA